MTNLMKQKQVFTIVQMLISVLMTGGRIDKQLINSCIPDEADISVDDVMRMLRKKIPAKLTYKQASKHSTAYWHIEKADLLDYKSSPASHKLKVYAQKQVTSFNRDVSCIQAITVRRGSDFIETHLNQ